MPHPSTPVTLALRQPLGVSSHKTYTGQKACQKALLDLTHQEKAVLKKSAVGQETFNQVEAAARGEHVGKGTGSGSNAAGSLGAVEAAGNEEKEEEMVMMARCCICRCATRHLDLWICLCCISPILCLLSFHIFGYSPLST
jgi:hypothetical protein